MWEKKDSLNLWISSSVLSVSLSPSLTFSTQLLDFFSCCLCTHAELAYLSASCASEPWCTSPNPFPEVQHKGRCPYVMTTNLLSFLDPNAMQENGPIAPAEACSALMIRLLALKSPHCTFFFLLLWLLLSSVSCFFLSSSETKVICKHTQAHRLVGKSNGFCKVFIFLEIVSLGSKELSRLLTRPRKTISGIWPFCLAAGYFSSLLFKMCNICENFFSLQSTSW